MMIKRFGIFDTYFDEEWKALSSKGLIAGEVKEALNFLSKAHRTKKPKFLEFIKGLLNGKNLYSEYKTDLLKLSNYSKVWDNAVLKAGIDIKGKAMKDLLYITSNQYSEVR